MIGETINQYKITSHLGTGGMGEVYLAVDSKLDREVALKFLPLGMAADGEVKARFLQEARAASALNHPNLCTIHDISDHDGRMFIVMEHIDGATLRDRKENLSLAQILEIGAQMADGLSAAHAKGIVHRDIKTENVMVRKDGIVQIMDFGLAKLRGVSRLTKEGSTLGTVGYMSPEQALGQDVDHRTDIFSLGVVLFELLTGQLPFQGTHEAAIMYEIVNVDSPPPSALKPEIDPELDRIVLECLQKDPDERHQAAKEVAKDLRRFKRDSGRKRVSRISQVRPSMSAVVPRQDTAPHETMAAIPRVRRESGRLPWIIAATATAIALGLAFMLYGSAPDERPVVRSHILPLEGTNLVSPNGGNLAVSPDGTKIAFVARDSSTGEDYLWVRPLNSAIPLKLANTKNAYYPFWSADSRQLGYFANGRLRKIAATGGPSLTICDIKQGRGGSWNAAGDIIFSPQQVGSAIYRVSDDGGDPTPVTKLDTTEQDYTHRWPLFLPDGEHFLYWKRTETESGGEKDAICVASLYGGIQKVLIRAQSNIAYAAGHIMFLREGTLMAQPFDAGSQTLEGDAFPIAEEVYFARDWSRGDFSASSTGVLAFQSGAFQVGGVLILRDRTGVVVDSVGTRGQQYNPEFSPGEKRVAVELKDPQSGKIDIWIHNLERGIKTRFTFDSGDNLCPVWSPDGREIAYVLIDSGMSQIYTKDAEGVQPRRLICEEDTPQCFTESWSADGKHIVYVRMKNGNLDTYVCRVADGEIVMALADTLFNEDWPELSSDGRWLAYSSDESGRTEVYVTAFPGPGTKWQVSTNGGDRPRWPSDGDELFYLDNTDRIMVAEVNGTGSALKVGKVEPLFGVHPFGRGGIYDVSSDGQRFMVNIRTDAGRRSVVTLVTNFDQELRKE